MIDFIIGDVVKKGEDYLVLQNNNIGYKIFTSDISLFSLEIGQKDVLIYSKLIVREDDMSLYGFTDEMEMDMFELLLMVSRIGPRVAIGVLSTLKPMEIKRAILKKDTVTLSTAPGIGKKTAERVILELKDKIDENELLLDLDETEEGEVQVDFVNVKEAIDALTSLGYRKFEVERVVKLLDTENMSVEDIIRQGLKKLSI